MAGKNLHPAVSQFAALINMIHLSGKIGISKTVISKTGMQRARYCIREILLMVVLVIILSPALAGDDSQINVITPPACASENALKDLTISSAVAILAAGLIAGFNPCLLAMLAFLASSMLASTGRRRDILTMVAFFSLGTFAVYIIFGVGLFSVLQEKSTAAVFRFALAAILLVLGVMQMEDARRLHS